MLIHTIQAVRRPLLMLLLLLSSANVHAYIDPGTGSLIIQSILAAVAGAAVAVRFYWHRIMTFLGFRQQNNDQESTQEDRED